MTLVNAIKTINSFHTDLKIVKQMVYDKCGFELTEPNLSSESLEYGACSFKINGKTIQHRVSKITPTKIGQFVTIWKRKKDDIIQPFDISDEIDFVIITSRSKDNFGQFVFPKSVLIDNEIISNNTKEGKRGFRVYPPWDIPNNKQAMKTQSWQLKYFYMIESNDLINIKLTQKLFSQIINQD